VSRGAAISRQLSAISLKREAKSNGRKLSAISYQLEAGSERQG